MPEKDKYILIQGIAMTLLVMGVWKVLAGWCLLSMAACGLSYAYFGTHLLNKSPEGNFHFMSQLVNAPWRWEYMIVVVIDQLRNSEAMNEISPGLWLGRYPKADEIPESVKLVVDLTAVLPKPAGLRPDVDYMCLPTLDGYAPEREPFLELVDKVARHEGPVLIHCARGRGRSATVMAAVLVKRGLAADIGEAYGMMKEARFTVRLHRQQLELLNTVALERIT